MTRFLGLLLTVAVIGTCSLHLAEAQLPTPATSQAFHHVSEQTLYVGYWTTEAGWQSELHLKNNYQEPISVRPEIRYSDGTFSQLQSVSIAPNDVKHLDVEELLHASNSSPLSQYGSLALRFTSEHHRNVYAAIMVRRIARPIAFHIDALDSSGSYNAGSREGIWWLPRKGINDWLIVTNQGPSPVDATLIIYDHSGQAYSSLLRLAPRATSRVSVRALVEQAGFDSVFGGITVEAHKNASQLDTTHIVYDEDAGFSGLLKMFDHDPALTLSDRDFAHTGVWTLRAPMLALQRPDPALGMSADTQLDPTLFIRNSSARRVAATLTLNWYGTGASGHTRPLATTLHPYETHLVRIADLKGESAPPVGAHWASVVLTTDGPPNEVQAVSASYDSTLKVGAQTPFSDQLSHKWAGGMWESDATHNSVITAGNGGKSALSARFTLYFANGTQRYNLEKRLAPAEQMWIDVRQLKDEKIPDIHGSIVPQDADMRSYAFEDLTNVGVGHLYEGKVVCDAINGHVTYGCAVCCGYNGTKPFYYPINVPLAFTAGDGI
jgi:hypothetical protein